MCVQFLVLYIHYTKLADWVAANPEPSLKMIKPRSGWQNLPIGVSVYAGPSREMIKPALGVTVDETIKPALGITKLADRFAPYTDQFD